MENKKKKIVIIGGGFGGVRIALELSKKKLPNTKIVLVGNKSHLEYTPALYKVVTGHSPMEVCIPLREIFKDKQVEILKDTITKIELDKKSLEGSSGSSYSFDYLVLALGSQTAYFNIPGLNKLSFGFKTICEALQLKKHLHQIFSKFEKEEDNNGIHSTHVVIVGGGASGTEVAGEMVVYMNKLAKRHGIDESVVTVDLFESATRLLHNMPEEISKKVEGRLRSLGVNLFLNRPIIKSEVEGVYLRNMQMKSKTVIWTAGVGINNLYLQTEGLSFDKKNRVVVDKFLQAQDIENVFIIGDGASTEYSGLAQTADYDGRYVADLISKKVSSEKFDEYKPKKPSSAIPIGPGWAAVQFLGFKIYGRIGWWMRRLADLRYFLSILPMSKAITVWRSGSCLCESCPDCLEN